MKEIYEVIASVFNLPVEEINMESSMDTLENWDSLNHMILVVALEQKFNVSFTPGDIIESVNMQIIKEVLKEKGVVLKNES